MFMLQIPLFLELIICFVQITGTRNLLPFVTRNNTHGNMYISPYHLYHVMFPGIINLWGKTRWKQIL